MVNKSGNIGTWTESSIVRYVRANGFDGADEMTKAQRLRLNGAHDQGDIGLCPGVVVSSKGGHMAEVASDAEILAWLAEMETQRINRGVDVAFLVRKRKGKGAANAGTWWAHMPGWTFVLLAAPCIVDTGVGHDVPRHLSSAPAVQMTLDNALLLLRRGGYGTPLPVGPWTLNATFYRTEE